jgi:hypothetical protein
MAARLALVAERRAELDPGETNDGDDAAPADAPAADEAAVGAQLDAVVETTGRAGRRPR